MNKPIKLTSQLTNPNDLLNKFIIYKYKNKSLSFYYIYKVYKGKIYSYRLRCFLKEKSSFCNKILINIENINIDIGSVLNNNNMYYNMYII